MAYQVALNPFTGQLQLVTRVPNPTGDVTGLPPTTIGAIASWADTTATTIQNTLTNVQASGAIEAQAYITRRSVVGTVTVNADETWIAPSIEITLTGSVVIDSDGDIIII